MLTEERLPTTETEVEIQSKSTHLLSSTFKDSAATFEEEDVEVALEPLKQLQLQLESLTKNKFDETDEELETRNKAWFSRVASLPDLKHVQYHGNTDYAAGRLPFKEIQVYRTATFLCMGPSPDRITSASIPVFYVPSTSTLEDDPEKIIKKYWALIGLPSHAPTAKIRRIPSLSPDSDSMDVACLSAFLSEDVAVGRRPSVVVCRALDSAGSGEWDALGKVREACSRFGCWMHVECDSAALVSDSTTLSTPNTQLTALRQADSITLYPTPAFKLQSPNLTPVTFFNTVDPRLMDPLHLDAFETFTPSVLEQGVLQIGGRRRSSAGGALIASVLQQRTSGEMSRSGSVSSVTSVNGGGGSTGNSAKLLKRMSSSALFHAACNGIVAADVCLETTKSIYTLPWRLFSKSGWIENVAALYLEGRQLVDKITVTLESLPDIDVHHTASSLENNSLTVLFRFQPTVSVSETLLTHPMPLPLHKSHVPEKPMSFIPKPAYQGASPWTPGFGTKESLMEMEQSRREAWGNKMNGELGTRVLFDMLSDDLKDYLQLELVPFAGFTWIRYQAMNYHSSSIQSHHELVSLLLDQVTEIGESINRTFSMQKAVESLVSKPEFCVELRYIPPSKVLPFRNAQNTDDQPFIGLGGIHFTPSYLELEADPIDPGVVKDLDALNECMADALASDHETMFSRGIISKSWNPDARGGLSKITRCIRIGTITPQHTLSSLLESILKKGRELERGDQFLATLSEVVRRGIGEAETCLRRQMVAEEVSLFKSLPVIGTVLGLMGVLPSPDGETAIVSEEKAGFTRKMSLESLQRATSSRSFDDVSGGKRGPGAVRAVVKSFTLSGGFHVEPIDETQIVKATVVEDVESDGHRDSSSEVDGYEYSGEEADGEEEEEEEELPEGELEDDEFSRRISYVGDGESH